MNYLLSKIGYLFFILTALFIPLEPQAAKPSAMQMQQDIVSYLNQYRVKHGLRPLIINQAITTEATLHSQEMAKHQIPFGHDGFSKRIAHLYQVIKQANGGAENVAYNYKTAKIVAEGWLKSPGHRKNIMGNYHLTGVGIAYDEKGKIYYTQLFIRTT